MYKRQTLHSLPVCRVPLSWKRFYFNLFLVQNDKTYSSTRALLYVLIGYYYGTKLCPDKELREQPTEISTRHQRTLNRYISNEVVKLYIIPPGGKFSRHTFGESQFRNSRPWKSWRWPVTITKNNWNSGKIRTMIGSWNRYLCSFCRPTDDWIEYFTSTAVVMLFFNITL